MDCKMFYLRIFIFVLLEVLYTSAFAQRKLYTINDGWRFFQGECVDAEDSAFNDTNWIQIHLPHTWNLDAYKERDYYRGTAWYRRTIDVPVEWRQRQVYIKLDAANKSSVLFVNGKRVGQHAFGYTAQIFDVTPFLFFDRSNVIAIQVNNSTQEVPPISGDFTFFGGVYRDVWLMSTKKQHFQFDGFGAEDVFLSTPVVSEEYGMIAMQGLVKNDASQTTRLELESMIYAPDGQCIDKKVSLLEIPSGEIVRFQQESDSINCPLLWTPETPHLYKVELTLRNWESKEIVDRTIHYTAFRWFHFDGKRGFFLNGKPYKLRGVCRHQEQKPIGIALTDEMHRRDFQMMKEMGANFIRISHYPQDDALLEMCDKQGMLVWEEIPVIDIVPETPGYGNSCESGLREMIRQHYNHPSIIMWGYMNEILLVALRQSETKEELKPVIERTLELANRLERALKEEDSTRVSAMAFHASNAYNEFGISAIPDIVGWNIYSGWYGGDLDGFEHFLDMQQRNYPEHPVIVSEYGAGSDRRLHSMHPRPFDFSIEYQQTYLEHYLPILENTSYVCGGSYWNFIDFSSAKRGESMPRINNKGLVYTNRVPKDVYYYFQAMWRNDIPVLHIASRDWRNRCGILRDDSTVIQPVKIYTNLPEIELFVDGYSLGCKKVENRIAIFNVPFSGSTPYLLACGEYDGRKVYDGLRVNFRSVPSILNEEILQSYELAINVGSNCFFTSDESQLTWLPDQAYVDGGWGYVGGEAQSSQVEIHLTDDGPLYQTLRVGLKAYRFDVPVGTYEVELFVADVFGENETLAYQLGHSECMKKDRNRFNIWCNGQLLDTLEPGRTNGYFQARRRKYIIRNETGHIILDFKKLSGECFLNGIKLRKIY